MTPRQVVEEWVRRFNAADADAIAELYREDATNHQIVQEPIVGKAAIREMFRREFASAKMTCIPEVIHEAGNVAILEWKDPLELRDAGSSPLKAIGSRSSAATGTSYRSSRSTACQSNDRVGRVGIRAWPELKFSRRITW
jgi:ketosteroid isomerase-like protein